MQAYLAPALLVVALLGCSVSPATAASDRAPTPVATATPRPSGPRIVASATTVAPGGKVTLTAYGLGTGTIDVEWNGAVFGKVQAAGPSSQPFQLVLTMPAVARAGTVTVTLVNIATKAHADIRLTISAHGATNGGKTATPAPSSTALPLSAGIPSKGHTANGCAITADQAAAEQYLLNLLNQHRKAAKVKPLTLSPTLSLASREHSCEMYHLRKLQHESADGSSPFDRFTKHGVAFHEAGENIGDSSGYATIPGIAFVDKNMMAEPNTEGTHHWNIVYAGYKSAGIGVIVASGQVWLTEDFVG
jgi:uncharacterized protein YkwD